MRQQRESLQCKPLATRHAGRHRPIEQQQTGHGAADFNVAACNMAPLQSGGKTAARHTATVPFTAMERKPTHMQVQCQLGRNY
jgi:hypothetical protein